MMEDELVDETEWSEGGRARRLLDPVERAKRGGAQQWRRTSDGRLVPPELIDRFLEEWCLVPPSSRPTQTEWAERNGVAVRTVIGWKRDQRFLDEWNRRLSLGYEHPDKVRAIVENMQKIAAGDSAQATKAAETYLKLIGLMKPPELHVKVEPAPQDLSRLDDKELLTAFRDLELLELEEGDG